MYIITVAGIELPTRQAVVEAVENAPYDEIQLGEIGRPADGVTSLNEFTKKPLIVTNSKRSFFATLAQDSTHSWYVVRDKR